MDEVKKILESALAGVEDQGLNALNETEGFGQLEESEKTEVRELVRKVSGTLKEAAHDQLLTQLTEHIEGLQDQHEAEKVQLREQADGYGEYLKEKANEYGDYIKEEANSYGEFLKEKADEFAEHEVNRVAENLDDYLNIAFAEHLNEKSDAVNEQKGLAFDYLRDQMQFLMSEIGVAAADTEKAASQLAESQDTQVKLSEAQERVQTLEEELSGYRRREAIHKVAGERNLSESQTERLEKLAEHLDPEGDRFEKRLGAIVEFVQNGASTNEVSTGGQNESAEDNPLSENYQGSDEAVNRDSNGNPIRSYAAAAKRIGQNRKF